MENFLDDKSASYQEYRLKEKVIHGKFKDELENYDLITIIILNLGEKGTTHRLLKLLHLLFMELKTSEEKEKILREEYKIEITREIKEELKEMCGLMEPLLNIVEKQVETESERKSQVDDIRNIVKKLNLTVQEAVNILEIPADK